MDSKIVIVIILALVVGALFSGLYFLFRDTGKGERTLRALMVRIGLTIFLMVILLVSLKMGWIHLHSISP